MDQKEVKKHLKDTYSCAICAQILYEPVTLLCQHTFCRSCLKEMTRKKPGQLVPEKRCPECRKRFFLPESDNVNFKVRDALDLLLKLCYTEEEVHAMRETRCKEEIRLDIREEVAKELRQELQDSIMDNFCAPKIIPQNVAMIDDDSDYYPPIPGFVNNPNGNLSLNTRLWRFASSPAGVTVAMWVCIAVALPVYVYRNV